MKKLIRPAVILLILLALLGVALTVVRVIGTRSLQRLIDYASQTDDLTVSLGDYRTDSRLEIEDPAAIEAICQGIRELEYKGVYRRSEPISPAHQAYYIILVSRQRGMQTIVISERPEQCRVPASPFDLSIQNCDRLFATVQALFDADIEQTAEAFSYDYLSSIQKALEDVMLTYGIQETDLLQSKKQVIIYVKTLDSAEEITGYLRDNIADFDERAIDYMESDQRLVIFMSPSTPATE